MTGNEFTMAFAADSRFIATARLAAASLAAEFEFDIDQIEDLRVATDELVTFLIEAAEASSADRIQLELRPSSELIEIEGRVLPEGGDRKESIAVDALTVRVLSAVADAHELGEGWGRIMKRRSPA